MAGLSIHRFRSLFSDDNRTKLLKLTIKIIRRRVQDYTSFLKLTFKVGRPKELAHSCAPPKQTMVQLAKTINAWGMPDFEDTLKQEIAQIGVEQLPLQQGLSASSYVVDNKLDVMILHVSEETGLIRAKVGIFYTGIIAGCSCADDPTPVNEHPEYCVVLLDIDKLTAETTVTLLAE